MIFSNTQLESLDLLYSQYNDTIKPLLIEVESRYEALPTPIHNELRSFNDHIARCYKNLTPDEIDNELRKANGHIKRTIFDCFKFLNVKLHDGYKDFCKKTKNVDLTTIDNGGFYLRYKTLIDSAQKSVRTAKKLESTTQNHDEAFTEYEKAYHLYVELEELININLTNINWARTKTSSKTLFTLLSAPIVFVAGVLLEDPIKSYSGVAWSFISSYWT